MTTELVYDFAILRCTGSSDLLLTDLSPKIKADGVYERFCVVKSSSGAKLTNQRALRSNEYISSFSAPLVVRFSEDVVPLQRVRDFLVFAGRDVGVGASRKLGWGRFQCSF